MKDESLDVLMHGLQLGTSNTNAECCMLVQSKAKQGERRGKAKQINVTQEQRAARDGCRNVGYRRRGEDGLWRSTSQPGNRVRILEERHRGTV